MKGGYLKLFSNPKSRSRSRSFSSHLSLQNNKPHSLFSASPILSQPDFNGDGIVNGRDVVRLSFELIKGRFTGNYNSIFDVNGDGIVNRQDLRLTVSAINEPSSLLDQQLATLYQDVKPFLSKFGMLNAITSGFGAFTPEFQGHGEHWVQPEKLIGALSKPKEDLTYLDYVGLNVEPKGNESLLERDVLGVFYLVQPDNLEELWGNFLASAADGDQEISFGIPDYQQTPDIFADDPLLSPHRENWHQHNSVYIHNPNPLDPTGVVFEQNLTPQELFARFIDATENDPNNEKVLWGIETSNGFDLADIPDANVLILPSFQMMHAWINTLTPSHNGAFGETNSLVSPDAPPLDSHGGHHGGVLV